MHGVIIKMRILCRTIPPSSLPRFWRPFGPHHRSNSKQTCPSQTVCWRILRLARSITTSSISAERHCISQAMPSGESPSPSPPPSLPAASAPGPRFIALQKIFNHALTSTLKTNSYANFSKCFPTPARHCPSALEGVWKQLNAKLEEGCVKEFEAIISERKVIEGLNGWDTAVEEAKRRVARGIEGEEAPKAYVEPQFKAVQV